MKCRLKRKTNQAPLLLLMVIPQLENAAVRSVVMLSVDVQVVRPRALPTQAIAVTVEAGTDVDRLAVIVDAKVEQPPAASSAAVAVVPSSAEQVLK